MRIKKLLLLMLVLLLFSTLTRAEVVDKRFRQEVLSTGAAVRRTSGTSDLCTALHRTRCMGTFKIRICSLRICSRRVEALLE